MTDIVRRRFPPVLADSIIAALKAVDELEHEMCFDLLARHRRNSAKTATACASTFGIGPVDTSALPFVDYEYIPLQWLGPICRLDEAFKKLHAYNAGGASDYVAEAVFRAGQQAVAQRQRERGSKIDLIDLENELRARGFFNTPDRERRSQIVRAIARLADLTPSSVNRHIQKILNAPNR